MELVTIGSEKLSASINSLGAELWSLTGPGGDQYLTDADPAFWSGRAPVLFPIVGRLREDRYRLGEQAYSLPKHGFARGSLFELVLQQDDRARFRLADSDATRAAYPFPFVLELEFLVRGPTLAMTASITNAGEGPMPFSFGFHPAFAWPLPGGAPKEAHRVVFERPEPDPIRRIDPGTALMLANSEPSPVHGDTLVPRASLFEADALIWESLSSRALRFGAEGGSWLEIAFPDSPTLAIWQKPGAPFLAIEPWQGFNDPTDFDGDFRDKPGVVTLNPGDTRRFRMDVTVHPG